MSINFYKKLLNYDIKDWKHILSFVSEIDFNQVYLHLTPHISVFKFSKEIKYCIISLGFEEVPEFDIIEEWCDVNKQCTFIILGDLDLNSYLLPANATFIEYRFYYLELAQMIENINFIPSVKNKKIKYKFSSLSFKERELRAIITAQLLTFAKDQSLISYHAEVNYSDNSSINENQQLIDHNKIHHDMVVNAKNSEEFKTLDWSFLLQPLKVDNFDRDSNNLLSNVFDVSNPAYSNSLINFSNETFSLGVEENFGVEFIRPSPYISEKTWKPLLSGCILINVAQPNVYKFLNQKYHLSFNYNIDLSYDNEIYEYERMQKIQDLILILRENPIENLIEENIDCCKNIQGTRLSDGYIEQFKEFNKNQDKKILDTINS